jgi:hypothetical protein
MTPTQAMTSPLEFMNEQELKYVYAYCDGEVRRAADNSPELDRFERRRQEAEAELAKRRK